MSEAVKLNIGPLEQYAQTIKHASQVGPIGDMLKQWGARYLAFTRRRFVSNSTGGGDWPDLAPSTKQGRRGAKRRKKRGHGAKGAKTTTRGSGASFAILRDTGTLLAALTIGAPGNKNEVIDAGIEVGFGGADKHPKAKGATIADIARFHNAGSGTLPVRKILVLPDTSTVSGMQADATNACHKLGLGLETHS